jgi:hypothetical protein
MRNNDAPAAIQNTQPSQTQRDGRCLQNDDDRWPLNGNQNAVFRLDFRPDLEVPLAAPTLGTVQSLAIRWIPVAVAIEKILELTRGFLFRDPVPLLVSAGDLIAPAGGLTLWIIGEPAPMFFHFPAKLLPIAS